MVNEMFRDLNHHFHSKMRIVALFLIYFPLIWTYTGMFWFPKGANYVPPIVIVACISAIYLFGIKKISRTFINTPLSILLLAISVYCIFQYQYHGSSSREMRAYISCFFFVCCFNKKIPNDNYILFLVGIAACGVITTTALQAYYFSISRVHGYLNAIVYATYSASIAIMCLCNFINLKNGKSAKLSLLLFIFLLVSTLLTGSRGVWAALFAAIFLILGMEFKEHLLKRKLNILILPLLFLAVVALLYPFVEHRIKKTLNEIHQVKSGRMDNNIGVRLQLWSTAKELAMISPVLGLGDSHSVELERLYKKKTGGKILNQPHYHNSYLDVLVKKGIIGLVLHILLLVYPMFCFRNKAYKPWQRNIAIGLFVIYSVSGLTDVPLNHDSTIYLYVFSVAALTGSIGS